MITMQSEVNVMARARLAFLPIDIIAIADCVELGQNPRARPKKELVIGDSHSAIGSSQASITIRMRTLRNLALDDGSDGYDQTVLGIASQSWNSAGFDK